MVLLLKLNVNTFRTHIFYLFKFLLNIFLLCFYLFSIIFPSHVTHDRTVLVRDGESKHSIIFAEEIELGKQDMSI